jgi:ABC-type dipeptide/oligopeptide/nickel transport system ATPase component
MGARAELDGTVLSVRGLSTRVRTRGGMLTAVDGIDFEVRRGEILALLGESGCGKSLTALSLMGLVRPSDGRVEGSVVLGGRDLLQLDDAALRRIRGADMAMIFQEPMSALNPVQTVGNQVAEALACHRGMLGAAARERVVALFREVGITSPAERFDSYPHELSGGTCQRVLIAMALACDPQLLIADGRPRRSTSPCSSRFSTCCMRCARATAWRCS